MSAVYPTIEDFDGLIQSLVPAPAAIGDSLTVITVLGWPWSVFEQGVQELAVGVIDLDAAAPWVMEVAGLRVNEPPGGLLPTEYRRIVAGRRLCIGADGSIGDAWWVFLGLTGAVAADATITQLVVSPSGPASLALAALIAWTPSEPWIQRAGRVLRDALPASGDAEALLATATTARWDTTPWTPSATWAYDLPLE